MSEIADNYRRIRDSIPEHVKLVIASKTREPHEIEEVIKAGAEVIGENYAYPEAYEKYVALGDMAEEVRWHLIGHLQKNKINKALPIFDCIQTVESVSKAKHIDKRVEKAGKERISVLLEINSAREEAKNGFMPDLETLREAIINMKSLSHLNIEGLMTMGPFLENQEEIRPYFRITGELFEKLQDINADNINLKILSMGMSNSYKIAIEEGSNMIRVGTAIFGPR